MMRVVHNRLGDTNSGAGYGIATTKSSGMAYPAPATYPYDEPQPEIEDFDEDDEQLFNQISRKIDLSNIAKSSAPGRTDRSSFTKMRLDLMENIADNDIMSGISPFPFSTIYGHFSGPAAGGTKSNFAFRVAPGKDLLGTTRGWAQAPDFNPAGDKIGIRNIDDMIDPAIRSLAKSNLMIKMSREDSE